MSDTPHAPADPQTRFREGDPIVFIGPKGHVDFAVLERGGRTRLRGHAFRHDEIIDTPPGATVRTRRGEHFHLLRPTLAEYVVKMPRFATVVYPKDLATVLVEADIAPGCAVLEAGLGSGALATTLLRAVGPRGSVVSYDVRAEAHERGTANVRTYLGTTNNHVVRHADIYEGIAETDLDRIVLDVAEPWHAIAHAPAALKDGGILASYSPTVPQVQQTAAALEDTGRFGHVRTLETMQRDWHVTRESVRPVHHMVGHTGFWTLARKVRPPAG